MSELDEFRRELRRLDQRLDALVSQFERTEHDRAKGYQVSGLIVTGACILFALGAIAYAFGWLRA